ncbi:hypothetical protein [Streptomyces goshikiensis]
MNSPSTPPAARAAGVFPDAELTVLPGAGRYPLLDDAAAFAAAVTGFLGR